MTTENENNTLDYIQQHSERNKTSPQPMDNFEYMELTGKRSINQESQNRYVTDTLPMCSNNVTLSLTCDLDYTTDEYLPHTLTSDDEDSSSRNRSNITTTDYEEDQEDFITDGQHFNSPASHYPAFSEEWVSIHEDDENNHDFTANTAEDEVTYWSDQAFGEEESVLIDLESRGLFTPTLPSIREADEEECPPVADNFHEESDEEISQRDRLSSQQFGSLLRRTSAVDDLSVNVCEDCDDVFIDQNTTQELSSNFQEQLESESSFVETQVVEKSNQNSNCLDDINVVVMPPATSQLPSEEINDALSVNSAMTDHAFISQSPTMASDSCPTIKTDKLCRSNEVVELEYTPISYAFVTIRRRKKKKKKKKASKSTSDEPDRYYFSDEAREPKSSSVKKRMTKKFTFRNRKSSKKEPQDGAKEQYFDESFPSPKESSKKSSRSKSLRESIRNFFRRLRGRRQQDGDNRLKKRTRSLPTQINNSYDVYFYVTDSESSSGLY